VVASRNTRRSSLSCRHTQEYYQRFVRESFVNHEDDVSAERLAQIVQRAREDAQWVLKKARGAPASTPKRVPALGLSCPGGVAPFYGCSG